MLRPNSTKLNNSVSRKVVCKVQNLTNGSSNTKTLILMRHAHSLEASPEFKDHERPISDKGRKSAYEVAQQLHKKGFLPDVILCSTSRRTKQTLDTMADAVHYFGHVDAHFLGSLYTVAALDGQTRNMLEDCILNLSEDPAVHTVMCMGHNRGWEEAAGQFSQRDIRLHAATAAVLQTHSDTWESAFDNEDAWELLDVVTPLDVGPYK